MHGAVGPRIARCQRWRVTHGAAFRIIQQRKNVRKGRVNPIDDRRIGAVVAIEAQVFEGNAADAILPHAQEESDIGLAETVDGLHRITDNEQRTAVIRLPATGQLFEQFDLYRAGILKLVHQQVRDAIVERLRQIGWRLIVTESQTGARGDLDEIDLTALLKGQPQLTSRQTQQVREGFNRRPFFIAQGRAGHLLGLQQGRLQSDNGDQSGQRLTQGLLEWLGYLVRRKAFIFRITTTPLAAAGQQQPSQGLPARQIFQRGAKRLIPVEQFAQPFRLIGCSKAHRRHQRTLQCWCQQLRQIAQIARQEVGKTGIDLSAQAGIADPPGMPYPLVTPCKQGNDQALEAAGIVVHEVQRRRHYLATRRRLFNHFQGAAGCRLGVGLGPIGHPRLRTEAAEIGHLARQTGA